MIYIAHLSLAATVLPVSDSPSFHRDPEAAHVVLSAGAPTWIVPLDVTTQVRIRQADVERIHSVGDPFHRAVADQVASYPGFVKHGGWTYLHDPLAVATTIDSALVKWQSVRAVIEVGGSTRPVSFWSLRRPSMGLPRPRRRWMWTSNAPNGSSSIDSCAEELRRRA